MDSVFWFDVPNSLFDQIVSDLSTTEKSYPATFNQFQSTIIYQLVILWNNLYQISFSCWLTIRQEFNLIILHTLLPNQHTNLDKFNLI